MLVQNLMDHIKILSQKNNVQVDLPVLKEKIFFPDKIFMINNISQTTETSKLLKWNKSASKLRLHSEILNQQIEIKKSKFNFGNDLKQTNEDIIKISVSIPEFPEYQCEINSSTSKNPF